MVRKTRKVEKNEQYTVCDICEYETGLSLKIALLGKCSMCGIDVCKNCGVAYDVHSSSLIDGFYMTQHKRSYTICNNCKDVSLLDYLKKYGREIKYI